MIFNLTQELPYQDINDLNQALGIQETQEGELSQETIERQMPQIERQRMKEVAKDLMNRGFFDHEINEPRRSAGNTDMLVTRSRIDNSINTKNLSCHNKM